MKRVGFRWLARGSCRHPEAMTMQGGSLCAVDFPAMVGVITHPEHGLILFDTGYDPDFLAATQSFPERLYRWTTPVRIDAGDNWVAWLTGHGIDRGDIGGVILSHFHGDHVAGLRHFAGLPIWCAAAGLDRVRRNNRWQRVRQGLLAALVPADVEPRARFFEAAPLVPLPADFAPFTEGRDLIGDGSLLAVELPGHCPGHWGLALRTEQDQPVLLAADAVWSIKAVERRAPPPRLTTALLGDTRRYRATLDLLHRAQARNGELAILPSHCNHAAARWRGNDAA